MLNKTPTKEEREKGFLVKYIHIRNRIELLESALSKVAGRETKNEKEEEEKRKLTENIVEVFKDRSEELENLLATANPDLIKLVTTLYRQKRKP